MAGKTAEEKIREARATGATELDLRDMGLTELPPEIGQLTGLQGLDLENNKLTALPPEIGQLTRLETLNLAINQLTALPPEIGQLTRLERLDLVENQLTALPPEIRNLTRLEEISLQDNDALGIPQSAPMEIAFGPSGEFLYGPDPSPADPADVFAAYFKDQPREEQRALFHRGGGGEFAGATLNFHGPVFMGDAHIDNSQVHITAANLPQIAADLALLRQELQLRASEPEHFLELAEITQAEKAAKANDVEDTKSRLGKIGEWARDVGKKASVSVVSDAIKALLYSLI